MFKPIPNYPQYSVSKAGQVYSTRSGKLLRPWLHQSEVNQYYRIRLYNKHGSRRFFVHELVMLAWSGPKPRHKEVDHINKVPTDNRLSNLRYVSKSQNRRNQTRREYA